MSLKKMKRSLYQNTQPFDKHVFWACLLDRDHNGNSCVSNTKKKMESGKNMLTIII